MEGNFPEHLSIRASDPKSTIRLLDLEIPSNLCEGALEENDVIDSQQEDIENYGIAGRIWETAYVMRAYLQPHSSIQFDPSCSLYEARDGAVIELGAGTGYLSLALARYISLSSQKSRSVKTLVLTDLPDVCSLLERNRSQKMPISPSGVNILIQPLSWGRLKNGENIANKLSGIHSSPLLSHIIGSDLVYFSELLAPLLRTLLQLSSPPFSTAEQPVQIIMSCMIRSLSTEMPFWSAFGVWFDFTRVLFRNKDGHWRGFGDGGEGDTCFIIVATRKTETLNWEIPAEGDLLRRGNESFETFLLMNLPGIYEEA